MNNGDLEAGARAMAAKYWQDRHRFEDDSDFLEEYPTEEGYVNRGWCEFFNQAIACAKAWGLD